MINVPVPERPTLQTSRLILRPFYATDAPAVRRLAGDREVAATTLSIPHPYEESMARLWISTHQERYEMGETVNCAITLRADDTLMGAIGLHIDRDHCRAEMGYWIGKLFWNQGYCTEAARAMVDYGLTILKLRRIYAMHMLRNPASGRVMQKIGMVYEGCLRQHILKWDVFEDAAVYGILQHEWQP